MHIVTLQEARTWAFKHAREIMTRVADYPESRPIMLQIGYGPSGLPHIGTVAELIRTAMIAKVLRKLSNRKVILLSFADDLDGMRKIPTGLPKEELLKEYIQQPLSKVPDPFGITSSFSEYNLSKLIQLSAEFGYETVEYRPTNHKKFDINQLLDILGDSDPVVLIRSSDMYYSGSFDHGLTEVMKNKDAILDFILPTLGEERKKTYSPFMPISPKSGKVLEVGVIEYLTNQNEVLIEDAGEQYILPVTGGSCKLQWKVDFGMRWALLQVDYEMAGKDIQIGTIPIASKVCSILGHEPPISPMYEMFLSEDGTKISKTKGNGFSLEQMLRYMPAEAIAHFMFLNPTTAKRLNLHKIPMYIDSFIKDLLNFKGEEDVENPIWYTNLNSQDLPKLTASMTLNLIQSLQIQDLDMLIEFFENRLSDLTAIDKKIITGMYHFYNETYSPPNFEPVPTNCKKYLVQFLDFISSDGLAMQTKLYELGNEAIAAGDIADLKAWFNLLYRALLGQQEGPRLGQFMALYGVENSRKLIAGTLNRN